MTTITHTALDLYEGVLYEGVIAQLVAGLDIHLNLIERQTEGLTHEDTLIQLPFRGNCMNWVLGHILDSRDTMLQLLGQDPVFTEAESALYRPESEPITSGEHALGFERLLDELRRTNTRLKEAIQAQPQDTMLEITDPERGRTRLRRLQGLLWHETYHVGQLEYLRQAAGKNDKVV